MLDIRFVRERPDKVRSSLLARGEKGTIVDEFLELDERRRDLIGSAESLKQDKNKLSKEIGAKIKNGENAEAVKKEVKDLSSSIEEKDEQLKKIDELFFGLCDRIPNLPHESVPEGRSEKDNPVIKECGLKRDLSFEAKDHLALSEDCELLDLTRAAKITGSGFALFTGKGAKLQRALINFMLDVHAEKHSYKEVFPPFLVNRSSMRGTGQIPKLEGDMYKIENDELFLIPTAEVPVTNLHAGEVLDEKSLPLRYTAYTACFRREAGSYGKDTKGLSRVHQFDKVELVKFVHPSNSMEELEKLLSDAEEILSMLELPYRVIELCTADLSFAAEKCYDIELWAPKTKKWFEVSSCSVFGDFQARRANIKYQPSDRSQKARYLHTLNGSGVALPRLVIALLENFQNEDGSVSLPEVLQPYFGSKKIEPSKKEH